MRLGIRKNKTRHRTIKKQEKNQTCMVQEETRQETEKNETAYSARTRQETENKIQEKIQELCV